MDRRKALKVALGGAAAAAVYTAPRIEGFSVAPDYASARTCFPKTNNAVETGWGNSSSGISICVGNGCGTGCCAAKNLPQVSGPRNVKINGVLNGQCNNTLNCCGVGTLSYTVSGLNSGSCNITLAGNCSAGTMKSIGTFPITTNGTTSRNVSCNGGATSCNLNAVIQCTC